MRSPCRTASAASAASANFALLGIHCCLEVSASGYISRSQMILKSFQQGTCKHHILFMIFMQCCSQDSEEGGQSAEHALHHAESKVRVGNGPSRRSRRCAVGSAVAGVERLVPGWILWRVGLAVLRTTSCYCAGANAILNQEPSYPLSL